MPYGLNLHRRNSNAKSAATPARVTKANGQVRAKPTRHNSPKLCSPITGRRASEGTGAVVGSFADAVSTGNFNRDAFHSIREFSKQVSARVSSPAKLSLVHVSSWTASILERASRRPT